MSSMAPNLLLWPNSLAAWPSTASKSPVKSVSLNFNAQAFTWKDVAPCSHHIVGWHEPEAAKWRGCIVHQIFTQNYSTAFGGKYQGTWSLVANKLLGTWAEPGKCGHIQWGLEQRERHSLSSKALWMTSPIQTWRLWGRKNLII